MASFFAFGLMRKNTVKLHEVKGTSPIKDIAVDNSYQAESGFKPRFAYLTTTGDVFVTEITEFGKPTMLLNKSLKNADKILRLFYDKGLLAVLYREDCDYTDFISWTDNLGPLYFNWLMKRLTASGEILQFFQPVSPGGKLKTRP